MSSVNDLTAIGYCLVPKDRKQLPFLGCMYYLPSVTIQQSPNRYHYEQWINEKSLYQIDGETIDYQYIARQIVAMSRGIHIVNLRYDTWKTSYWKDVVVNEGIWCKPFPQTYAAFYPVIQRLETDIYTGRIRIEQTKANSFNFSNATLCKDSNGNCKFDKSSSLNKIDGVVAMTEAYGSYLDNEGIYKIDEQ